jgi:hypothetical protein
MVVEGKNARFDPNVIVHYENLIGKCKKDI